MTESNLSAIERARMVAAKLSAQIPDSNMATKRAADSSDDHNSSKKFASITDAVGANLAMLKAQNLGGAQSEEHRVPDKQVGLIIGRGGEQLRKIEAESQCKLNIAPDSNGLPDRIVTLIGTKDAIERAKRLIDEVLKRTPGYLHSHGMDQNGSIIKNGVEIFEMKVPGNKCGLVIGKGGETIKKLSEQYGVKLVVVQDSSTAPGADKPLRITGEPEKVSKAREAVLNLINPKDINQSSTNEYGSKNGSNQSEVLIKVPGDKAGIVIGKGGESIKDIKRRSGAHVEIDKSGRTPVEGNDKIFVIKGTNEQIQTAQQMIYEKITGVQGSQPPNGYFNNSTGQMVYGQQQQQPAATDGMSNYNQWSGYQQGAAVDPNMSAWQAYYQYYGQAGMQPGAATTNTTSTSAVQPTINPQTGQADYSQAWVEYYRSLGMHEQAEAILRQTQQS